MSDEPTRDDWLDLDDASSDGDEWLDLDAADDGEDSPFSDYLQRQLQDIPEADDRLQTIADLKTVLASCYAKLGGESLAFTDAGAGGAPAQMMRTTTQEITTWAAAYEKFGPDFIIPESDSLNYKWWAAILKTADPVHWLEQARTRQLNAAQIRSEAGVKQERKPPFLDIGAAMKRTGENLLISPDCTLPEQTPDECRIDLKVRIKE